MGAKRGIILVAIALVILAGVVIWEFSKGEGPVYQGRNLSVWLKRLPGKGTTNRGITWAPLETGETEDEKIAEEAVRQIGTNAIPFLLDEMRSQNLGFKEAVDHGWEQVKNTVRQIFSHNRTRGQAFSSAGKNTAELRHWDAARGFHALGPLGKPAIPELVKLLNNPDTSPDAAYALSVMDAEGLEPLKSACTNKYDWIGMCAVWALGQTPTNAQATPLLLGLLHDKSGGMRMAVAWSLGEMRAQPELVAPALAANLADADPNARSMAEEALKEFGIEKTSAAALLAYLNDPKPYIRMAATNALRTLYPEDAAKAGIKLERPASEDAGLAN